MDFLQYTWTCCTCIISAVELKLPIIESSEEQQAKLKKDYAGQLTYYSICDPLSVEEAKRIDDDSTVAISTLWCNFSYILEVREFDVDYEGS